MAKALFATTLGLILSSATTLLGEPSTSAPVLVDAIVASVDGKPISLSDIIRDLPSVQVSRLPDFQRSPEAQSVLDRLILERLIRSEGELRGLQVPDEDVERYVGEVAQQNGLGKADFEKALAARNISIIRYREQATAEILKSKLAHQIRQSSASVSDEEIQRYMEEHPETSGTGATVSLLKISLGSKGCGEVQSELDGTTDLEDAIASCEKLGLDCLDLGKVGLLQLLPDVATRIRGLDEGEISACKEDSTDAFLVLAREEPSEHERAELREKAKQALLEQKRSEKLASFLSQELYKKHAVERFY